jgi:dTDP-4-amino-4,6-dideoxygalactose transaminase
MIPFNRPYLTGHEAGCIAQAHRSGQLAGDGEFTRRCSRWLERQTGAAGALLTHSCTAALEMAALLLGVGPGDEVVMPSFTFVSTANAFVLRGAVPVFVDIRPDTLNIDERRVEAAITPRTKAIVVVHYGGVACDMDSILAIAARYGLRVVEDAAQGLMAGWRGRALGSIGDLGAVSFHETKNIVCGEGGAILVNDRSLMARAEVIREKGTDRSRFFRGEVDRYTWVDAGSSFLPGELTAAFLWAQMEQAQAITTRRLALWERYHALLAEAEDSGLLQRPSIPTGAVHNAHLYRVMLPDLETRTRVIASLKAAGIQAVFHYVPLHSSPAGRRWGRCAGELPETDRAASCLLRLPLWLGLEPLQESVVQGLLAALR